MKYWLRICLLVSFVLLTACQVEPLAATPVPAFITATLPPTPRPPTPTAMTETPLASAIRGQATARLNVRPEPGTTGEPLGMLENAVEVEVLGQDLGGNWYQIVYPAGPEGKGWVNAAYIRLLEQRDVPVIGVEEDSLQRGLVTETLNVRSRPDSGSASLGILLAQTSVVLTGKSSDGKWLQIEYPAGSDERGWVAAAYVEAEGMDNLPLVSETGTLLGTATPTVQVIPTFTLLPAPDDGDSMQTPVAQVAFSPEGAQRFSFTGQVSAPEGDTQDWVAFIPYAVVGRQVTMRFSLQCSGRGDLAVQLLQDGQPIPDFPGLTCGDQEQPLSLVGGQLYHLRFQIAGEPVTLQSVGYIITILNGP